MLSTTPAPAAWRRALFRRPMAPHHAFYLVSPVFFLVLGLRVIQQTKALAAFDEGYPWNAYGHLVALQALVCFLADVYTFGTPDVRWVLLDMAYAATTVALGVPIMTTRWLYGANRFGLSRIIGLWAVAAYAGTTRTLAYRAFCAKRMDAYFFYHACWHSFALLLLPVVPFGDE